MNPRSVKRRPSLNGEISFSVKPVTSDRRRAAYEIRKRRRPGKSERRKYCIQQEQKRNIEYSLSHKRKKQRGFSLFYRLEE